MASASVNVGSNETHGRRNRARVGGSAFTVFAWNSQPILFAKQISHQSPTPVGPGTVPIHPMDTPYPVELITPMAATMGTITLELYELWGSTIWERLEDAGKGLGQNPEGGGPVDIVGIFKVVAERGSPITIFKYIRYPSRDGTGPGAYTEEYHNVVVSQVMNGETIEVGTMEVLKQMVVNYTHSTIGGNNPILQNKGQLGGAISSNYESSLNHFGAAGE
jgi:hypothetical protein